MSDHLGKAKKEGAGKPLRDERGHFCPKGKGPRKSETKGNSLKKDLDENTVKIKIVKEQKPLPPK